MPRKLPFLQFFVDDYANDETLQMCSLAAQGLWIRLLCRMHKSVRRGYLQQATGKPLTLEQLAGIAGRPTGEVSRLLQELIDSGVPSVTEHGVIYSRRMVRDEHLRQVRSRAGRKGGKATALCRDLLEQNAKQDSSKVPSKPIASELCLCFSEEEERGGAGGEEPAANGRPPPRRAFVKPTVEEVRAYCSERKNRVDPEAFVSHYESNGWRVGRNPMKNWKAAVHTWEKNEANFRPPGKDSQPAGPKETHAERSARLQREREESRSKADPEAVKAMLDRRLGRAAQ